MPRFRFTLRSLLILCAIAAGIAWWGSAPRLVAKRFVHNVRSGQIELAANMYVVDGTADMLVSPSKGEATAWIPGVSFTEGLRCLAFGRQRVELTVTFTDPDSGEKYSGFYPLEASVRGIHVLPAALDHNFRTSNTFMEDR